MRTSFTEPMTYQGPCVEAVKMKHISCSPSSGAIGIWNTLTIVARGGVRQGGTSEFRAGFAAILVDHELAERSARRIGLHLVLGLLGGVIVGEAIIAR